MESRSSESSYGFGGYSGGYSSESSYASESRNSYRPSSSFSSKSALESRPSIVSAESRATSFSSESRGMGIQTSITKPKTQYNSLDDIDKLIERLEASFGTTQVTSERANQILAQRKQKIESLKQLVADARKAETEERIIQQLEQENSELDDAIDSMNKGFHR